MLCVFKNSGKQRRTADLLAVLSLAESSKARISAANKISLADSFPAKQQKQRKWALRRKARMTSRAPSTPIGGERIGRRRGMSQPVRGSGIMSPNKANRLSALGGMTPQMDYDFLERAVVSAIYGPGTNIAKIAAGILSLIQKHRLAA
jgi:hypothetical protein